MCGPARLRDYLVNTARSFIFSTGPSPWVATALCESIDTVGEQDALAAEAFCVARGIQVRAIRPPTVPEHGSRLRLSLHTGLSHPDVERVLGVFGELADSCKR